VLNGYCVISIADDLGYTQPAPKHEESLRSPAVVVSAADNDDEEEEDEDYDDDNPHWKQWMAGNMNKNLELVSEADENIEKVSNRDALKQARKAQLAAKKAAEERERAEAQHPGSTAPNGKRPQLGAI